MVKKTEAIDEQYPTVTVFSCEQKDWIADSEKIGIKMSTLLDYPGDYVVKAPKTALGFFTCWNRAGEFVWMHTRGSSDAIYDMIEGGETPKIISKDELAEIAVNERIRFVMISSAGSASPALADNVAYQLSKKINPMGIVIGCMDGIEGYSEYYRGINGKECWRVYRNGEVIATLPQITLVPADLRNIYRKLCFDDIAPKVTVFSCVHKDWIADSERIGIKMSTLLEHPGDYVVKAPKKARDFSACWNGAGECVWMHTCGNSDAIYGMIEGGETPKIISKDALAEIAVNERIRFVMISSAGSASPALADNVAYQLSKKIDPMGIVIGCMDGTVGYSEYYQGINGKESWRVYRNGEVIATLPQVRLVPADLCKIYRALCSDDPAPQVTVFSCAQKDWIADSVRMGKEMSSLFGRSDDYIVKAPESMLDFFNTWNRAGECVIVHSHGSIEGLYNQIESGEHPPTPTMIDKAHIAELIRNDNIIFAFVSACATAGGKEDDNVAYWISKKINPMGIVIANSEDLIGNASYYHGKSKKQTWKVYRDGIVLATIPQVVLRPPEVYEIYKSFHD